MFHWLTNPMSMQSTIKVWMSFWLVLVNWMIGFVLVNMWYIVDFYMIEVVNMRLNSLSCAMLVVVFLVSSLVILCSVDYISSIESCLFLCYISIFQFTMIVFVVSNDLVVTLASWDWLGLISYLLINFWASKTKSGIKAVVYNQIGDVCFLLIIAFSYSLLPFINYSPFIPMELFSSFVLLYPLSTSSLILALSFLMLFFTKSAMLPMSSWLINSMAAPTPVSALLHSSTMVIAGVYLALLMNPVVIVMTDGMSSMAIILLVAPLCSLAWSVFKAISLSDIKSVIAFSTISQISYMFLATFSSLSLIPLFHIIVHAVFKSMLFLLSGSLIHAATNFQSIYRLKIYHSLMNIIFVLAGSVLIISLSKESIIHSSHSILSSAFVSMTALLGGIFTMIYTLKIYAAIH